MCVCARQLIDAKETTELLRPFVVNIVQEYFRIMTELDNDVVLSSLQVSLYFSDTVWIAFVLKTCFLFLRRLWLINMEMKLKILLHP